MNALFQACSPHDGGNFLHNWTVRAKELQCIEGLCRFTFCNVYGIGHTYLEELCFDIKDGVKISNKVFGNKYVC